jgi:NTE family protein
MSPSQSSQERTYGRLRHVWDALPGVGSARRETTAFVLAGGGHRGALQVGMLAELVDRGIEADRVYGASVGALNGCVYCGDPGPSGIRRLEEIWRGLKGEDAFPSGRVPGPWRFFQQRSAVHSNAGLRKIINAGLTFELLEDATVPFEVVATSLVDGSERWLQSGPAVDAILASAAIPAIFPPVTIDGEALIDGAVVNNVPISRAVEAGATRIYVLLCGPEEYRPEVPKRPVESLLVGFYVAVHSRFARERAAVPRGVELVVFGVNIPHSADYRDFSRTSALIEAGRAQVAAVLDGRAVAHEPEVVMSHAGDEMGTWMLDP